MAVGSSSHDQPAYVLSSAAVRRADEMTINELMVPGILLMEAAGMAVAREAARRASADGRVLIMAGPGNNGGDGFAAARFLHREGIEVFVLSARDVPDYEGDAKVNARIVQHLDIPLMPFGRSGDNLLRTNLLNEQLKNCSLIIDALLGTGVQGSLRPPYRQMVRMLNKSPAPVLAVDVPTGVDADTGAVPGPVVDAEATVTFAAPKVGLILEPGCEYTGELIVADIGIPYGILRRAVMEEAAGGGPMILVNGRWVADRLPPRRPTGHKGTFGHALIIGGSQGLTGAPALSATAAQRAGSGMVTCAVADHLHQVMECKLTSAMTSGFTTLKTMDDVDSAVEELIEQIAKVDAVALGPGLGTDPLTNVLVESLLSRWDDAETMPPMVIDADALNAVAPRIEDFRAVAPSAVLTPHPGEMARLLDCTIREVMADRQTAARRAAAASGCVVILKGAPSVTACPCGCLLVNSSGNVGLAAGGSGDILTGIIASLLGQGLTPRNAAAAGCYIHGRAADCTRRDVSVRSMIPEDVMDGISPALEELE